MSQEITSTYGAVKIDGSGRLVIPLALRAKKGLQTGDELVFGIDDHDRIVLCTYDEAIDAIQDAFHAGIPTDVSLVDELIAERRTEAGNEADESR